MSDGVYPCPCAWATDAHTMLTAVRTMACLTMGGNPNRRNQLSGIRNQGCALKRALVPRHPEHQCGDQEGTDRELREERCVRPCCIEGTAHKDRADRAGDCIRRPGQTVEHRERSQAEIPR